MTNFQAGLVIAYASVAVVAILVFIGFAIGKAVYA